MQDKIILGMLSIHPMSVYELKKNMEKSTSMFYNTSIGSIHPACQKLLRQGFISCHEESEGKRAKKVFSITKQGEKEYQTWLISPLGIGKIKDELLLRLFFFSDSDDQWRTVLDGYLQEIKQMRKALAQQKSETDLSAIPEEHQQKAYFQLSTLDLGYDYFCFIEDWLEQFIEKKAPGEK